MRKYYYLICITFILSCSVNTDNNYKIPKKVIIAGRIINSDSLKKDIEFSISRPGMSRKVIRARLDSLGDFYTSFESYTPTDIWVEYKASFRVLIHPGDSIYITFDGNLNNTPDVLESVKYMGDAAKLNQDAAIFQQMYYSNTMIQNQNAKRIAVKELDTEGYLKFLDTMRLEARMILETFINDVAPEKEAISWASTSIENDYFIDLANYPDYHRYLNNINKKDWDVPTSYYELLLTRFPINKSMLINGSAISSFINTFHFYYARLNLFKDPEYKKCMSENLNSPNLTEIQDSLIIHGLIKYTPDSLARQLVLSEMLHQRFDSKDIKIFEKNRTIVERYIEEPFLMEPINERYSIIKDRLARPQIYSEAIFKKAKKSSVNQIIDSIMVLNKSKVIYIDFWATWCTPCLSEFPRMKALMKQMENKDVSFVFICLDSKEKIWKAKIDEINLGGQHHFLSEEQSNDIHEIFEFTGVPYHVLVDQKGTLIDKGVHLTGSIAKKEIEILLQ